MVVSEPESTDGVRIVGLKEIKMYHRLFIDSKNNPNKNYSKTDIGSLIDDKYPNKQTHAFVHKLILFNVLILVTKTQWRGKVIDLYSIDKHGLIEIVKSTQEYKIFMDFISDRYMLRILKVGEKKA